MLWRKIFLITLLGACSFISDEKPMNAIITTEQVFLDSPSNIIHFTMDDILPNLKQKTQNQIQGAGFTNSETGYMVQLKVKTTFSGKVPVNKINEVLIQETNFVNIESKIETVRTEKEYQKTTIDKLIEDPSGMIIGFAIGASMSNPLTAAPIGMAVGTILGITTDKMLEPSIQLTILDIEIHEQAKRPIWYKDTRIHKKDEFSIRKYEYAEETNWKVYKTRIIVRGKYSDDEIAKRIVSLIY